MDGNIASYYTGYPSSDTQVFIHLHCGWYKIILGVGTLSARVALVLRHILGFTVTWE